MKKFIVFFMLLFLWGCVETPIPQEEEFAPESIQLVNMSGKTTIEVGDEDVVLMAIVSPSNASNKLEWSTSDANIATVEDGIVTAVGAGEVTITVKSQLDNNIYEAISFEVIDNTPIINNLKGIVEDIIATLPDETSEKLPLIFYQDGVQIRYSSSDENLINVAGSVSPARGDRTVTFTVKASIDGFEYQDSKDIIVKGYTLKDISNRKLTFTYLYTNTGFNEGDLEHIDVINLSFAGILNNRVTTTELQSKGSRQIIADAHQAGVRVVLAIGGWGVNGFSEAINTPTTRATFIKSIIDVIKEQKYDGIDLDWEYPTKRYNPNTGSLEDSGYPNDKQNYTKFIQELRREMDKIDTGLTLSLAVPAGAWAVNSYYEIDKINASIDFLHIMSYDLINYIPGELTNHHTNIYNSSKGDVGADAAIKAYIYAGLNKSKIIVGAAFYGHAFYNISQGSSDGYWVNSSYLPANKGTISYRDIKRLYLDNPDQYTVYYDEQAIATWLYGNNTFISFDDEVSIAAKAQYVINNGYGGLMSWQYSQDDIDGTLIKAMYNNLNSK